MTLGEYLALVTPFHATRPRYMHTLAALLRPVVEIQEMLRKLIPDFDLDTAKGVQLDIVGLWIGRTRWLSEPLTDVFFALNRPGQRVGLNEGIWWGPYLPTEHLVAMDDETYRTVLKLQAVANHWDGNLESIQGAFDRVFPGVAVIDHQDMTMEVIVPADRITTVELEICEQDFPIKPAGVHARWVESTVPGEPIFGLNMSNALIAGLNQAAWGEVIYER